VQLNALAGGGSQGAVAVLVGEAIEGEIQLWGDIPAGVAGTQHHLIVLLLALGTVVAVILLVRAMKLKDLNRRFREVVGILQQFAGHGLAQEVTILFDRLHLRRGRPRGGRSRRSFDRSLNHSGRQITD
jgi:hypothetical protein